MGGKSKSGHLDLESTLEESDSIGLLNIAVLDQTSFASVDKGAMLLMWRGVRDLRSNP